MNTRDPHQTSLMLAANSLGIAIEDLAPVLGMDLVVYSRGSRAERVRMGRIFSHLGALPQRLCDDKHACKSLLRSAGIPVPEGIRYSDPEEPAVAALLSAGGRWVNKPLVGSHSKGVHLNLQSLEEVRAVHVKHPGWAHVLERQIEGRDLRMQAIGGRFVAACRREPAQIVGDGHATVETLLARRREVVRAINPENDLVLDDEVRAHLTEVGLGLSSVPFAGQAVTLRAIPSLAAGGTAVDVTDIIHPDWIHLVETVGALIGVRVYAVDAVTPDPGLSPKVAGAILEVNARPQWLHHTISERRQHDIPAMLLADLFGDL